MIKLVKNLKEMIANRKYRKVLKSINNNDDIAYIDWGSTSMKMAFNGEIINFKSSIRKILDTNEITPATKNFIKVNNEYFIIGESEKSNEVCDFKVNRKYMDIAILYGIKVLRNKGIEVPSNLKLNILVPYDELKFKSTLESKLNKIFKVDNEEIILNLNQLFVEGECSAIYIREHYKSNKNLITINVGGKTTDVILLTSEGNREKIVSIDLGTQYFLSQIVRYTKAPTTNILSQWLRDNYKFNKEELEHIREAGKEFINNIWQDLFAGVVKISNPQNTEIVIVGGGANILKNSISEAIPKGYIIKTLSEWENVNSDLLGMLILSKQSIDIPKDDTPEDEVKEKRSKRVSKYDEFVILKNQGMEQQQIIDTLGIALQTYRNMLCRWNKENLNSQLEMNLDVAS